MGMLRLCWHHREALQMIVAEAQIVARLVLDRPLLLVGAGQWVLLDPGQ